MTFNADGSLLAAAGSGHTINVWETAGWHWLGNIPVALEGVLLDLRFTPDDWLVAVGCTDEAFNLDLTNSIFETTEPIPVMVIYPGDSGCDRVIDMALNSEMSMVVSGVDARHPFRFEFRRIRNTEELPMLPEFPLFSTDTNALAFSPDGSVIAFGTGQRYGETAINVSLQLWKLGAEVSPVMIADEGGEPGGGSMVNSVAFSPDGTLLADASGDATGDNDVVRIWDVSKDWRESVFLTALRGHFSWVTDVSFSPDGKLIASVGNDSAIRLWGVVPREGDA
jgi:WD40 repeat protein